MKNADGAGVLPAPLISVYFFLFGLQENYGSSSLPQSIHIIHICMLSCFSHVLLFVTSWTVSCQAPLSLGFSRQEYRSGQPFPPPGDLPNPGIKPESPASPTLQALYH